MLGDSGRFETRIERYLPYRQHISDELVALDDGSVLAMVEIPGLSFELEDVELRNNRAIIFNGFCHLVSEDNVTMHTNFVHGEGPPKLSRKRFPTCIANEIVAAYRKKTFGEVIKENAWYISVIVTPRVPFEGYIKRLKRDILGLTAGLNQETIQQAEDIIGLLLFSLARYSPRRLGVRKAKGWAFTEIGEAIAHILTGRRHTIPITNGHLGNSIYVDPVVFGGVNGRYAYKIDSPDRPLSGMIIGWKEYPSKTTVGMFNDLLGLECPIVFTHSFKFLNRASAQFKLQIRTAQMENAGDKAISLIRGLLEMQDDIASNQSVTGSHHFSAAVYSPDPRALPRLASQVLSKLNTGGARAVRETRGAMGAYFAQAPGTRSVLRCRPGVASCRNYSHFISLDSFPTGAEEGYWQDPVLEFITNGGTKYSYHPHVQDVGHTFVCAQTTSGKTTLFCLLIISLLPSMGDNGTIIAFDKDGGMALTFYVNGGTVVRIRRGEASGIAPLLAYDYSERNVAHLTALFERAIKLDTRGDFDPRRLRRGIARQLKMPCHLRSMWAVRAFMGFEQGGPGERFERWCAGQKYGWLFDGGRDTISVDARLVNFDLTELLPTGEVKDDGCADLVANDIMYRLRGLMDGRRIAVFCDEAKYYMSAIPAIIEDFSRTGRKKELMLFIASQEPGDFLSSDIGRAILAQCPSSFLFPNENAKMSDYGSQGLNCTEAQYKFVKESGASGKREVMLRRQNQSVRLLFDLSGLADELELLSSHEDTIRLMDEIRDELGPDAQPDDLADEFRRRYRSVPRLARRQRKIEEAFV